MGDRLSPVNDKCRRGASSSSMARRKAHVLIAATCLFAESDREKQGGRGTFNTLTNAKSMVRVAAKPGCDKTRMDPRTKHGSIPSHSSSIFVGDVHS